MTSKVWFITGTSRGLGRVWAQAALERGDRVVATARDIEALEPLARQYGDAILPLALDVNDRHAVFAAMDAAVARFGRLDVVVSNAGYALFGTIEESSEPQARAQFETNLFGTLWVIQAALPHLRAQGRGHILVTSSVAGVITFPTAGVYNATKWAVEGLTETLASEVGEFGIKVTLIEPGGYDTDWRAGSATNAAPMAVYENLRQKIKAFSANRTLGNPSATAPAILAAVDAEEPPLRLFLGKTSLPAAKQAYSQRLAIWDAWVDVSEQAQG